MSFATQSFYSYGNNYYNGNNMVSWNFEQTTVTDINTVPISPSQYWDNASFPDQNGVIHSQSKMHRNPYADKLLNNWDPELDDYCTLMNIADLLLQ